MSFFKKLFGKSDSGDDASPTSSSAGSAPAAPAGPLPTGVVMTTSLGDITIALYGDRTPKTVENFATLCDTNKYDNCPFHRIIAGFMIQGGDFTRQNGTGGQSIWGRKFEDEFHPTLKHDRKGVLSMANSGPRTNGSQFFITLGPTPHLDGKHTVFGQVVDGLDIVDKLGAVRTGSNDKPLQPVMIVKAQSFST